MSLRPFICLVLCGMAISALRAEDDWTQVESDNAPSARQGHSMVALPDGKIALFGGEGPQEDLFNDLFIFEDSDWAVLNSKSETPPPRSGHVSWAGDNKVYIHGGMGAGGVLDDTWVFDLETETWSSLLSLGDRPSARRGHTATLLEDGSVLLAGGRDAQGVDLTDIWLRQTDGSYERISVGQVTGFSEHVAAVSGDGQLHVFTQDPPIDLVFDLESRDWLAQVSAPPTLKPAAAVAAKNDRDETIVFVFGGIDHDKASDLVFEYNLDTGEVIQRQEHMPVGIAGARAVALPLESPGGKSTAQVRRASGRSSTRAFEEAEVRGRVLVFGGLIDDEPTDRTFLFSYRIFELDHVFVTVEVDASRQLNVRFNGTIQESADLETWSDLNPQPASPFTLDKVQPPLFLRAVK